MTLFIISNEKSILLGFKKRGWGQNKYCGFGGKVEHTDSSIFDAALRELKEEAGIIANKSIQKCGILNFYLLNSGKHCEVHVFHASGYEGDIVETDEMRPQWFDLDSIPYSKMWLDDIYWLPHVINGEKNKKFYGKFTFINDDKLLSWEMNFTHDEN